MSGDFTWQPVAPAAGPPLPPGPLQAYVGGPLGYVLFQSTCAEKCVTSAPYFSSDGSSWQVGPEDVFANSIVYDVVALGDRFVAVGATRPSDSTIAGAVWKSTDGLSWTAPDVSDVWPALDVNGCVASNIDGPQQVASLGGAALIATGFASAGSGCDTTVEQRVWLSSDGGTTWTLSEKPNAATFVSLFDGSRVVATGSAGAMAAVWVTDDGRDWTRAEIEGPAAYLSRVVELGDEFLAYGSDKLVWQSDDGDKWKLIEPGDMPALSGPMATLGDELIAATDGGITTSTDGLTWTDTVTEPFAAAESIYDVLSNGSSVVVFGQTPDGQPLTWSGTRR